MVPHTGSPVFISMSVCPNCDCVSADVQSKPIEVTVEEPKAQTVRVGSTVSFICTAKSKVTLVNEFYFNFVVLRRSICSIIGIVRHRRKTLFHFLAES